MSYKALDEREGLGETDGLLLVGDPLLTGDNVLDVLENVHVVVLIRDDERVRDGSRTTREQN